MTKIYIFELQGNKNLEHKGTWEDGKWLLDARNFKEIEQKYESFEEQLLDRFDGPLYYAVRDVDLDQKKKSTLNVKSIPDVTMDEPIGGFMRQKLRKVKLYKNDKLREEDISDENWERLMTWVEKYG